MERIIYNPTDLGDFMKLAKTRKYPFTLRLDSGKKRSSEQNRLQRLWMLEAQMQGDQTAEEYRGYSKLHFGVPILRRDSEEFREAYDRIIRPLPYEQKLAMMMEPLDWPVTRAMTTKQKTEYLDKVWQHFTGLGFRLTEPDGHGLEAVR